MQQYMVVRPPARAVLTCLTVMAGGGGRVCGAQLFLLARHTEPSYLISTCASCQELARYLMFVEAVEAC
jgi:hypothetical protein